MTRPRAAKGRARGRIGDILRARNSRRRELRGILRDRQAAVETLLELKRGEPAEKQNAPTIETDKSAPKQAAALKRYRNE